MTEQNWKAVQDNPLDFEAWEVLCGNAEAAHQQVQGKENLFRALDAFLTKFPLCFGYWKKYSSILLTFTRYADWTLSLKGPVESDAVFQRALAAIGSSVTLWSQYCHFTMSTAETDDHSRRYVYFWLRGLF
jgi:pre-mRNA-processing factor 39